MTKTAGILDAIIGAAEEQEFKGAVPRPFLSPLDPLDASRTRPGVEARTAAEFGAQVDFGVEDGLGKLERLGLLGETGAGPTDRLIAEALGRPTAGFRLRLRR